MMPALIRSARKYGMVSGNASTLPGSPVPAGTRFAMAIANP
jgi:hypothetical protein